jgi:hypothetical protein
MADQAQQLKSIADKLQGTYLALTQAARNIAGLLQLGRATCDEVKAYNLWALAIYNTQRGMLQSLKAGGQQGIPDLPTYPTLFVWKGQAGANAHAIQCAAAPSSLSGAMKRALRGPSKASPLLSTNEITIATRDQNLYDPENSPSFAALLKVQASRQEQAGVGVVGVLIAIAAIAITVTVAIAAIMHYLEVSKVEESNTEQVRQQAVAFANYTAARLACYSSCTQQGKSTEECVSICAKLIDKPEIKLPGSGAKWGWLQWTGFTVVAGTGMLVGLKLIQRHREGKSFIPDFELPG